MSEQLFRKQVIEARQGAETAFGKPVAAVSGVWSYFLIGLTVFFISLFVFLFIVKAPRHVVANGYLKYSEAELSIYAVSDGVLETLYVKDGDFVEKGDAIGNIVSKQFLSSGGNINEKRKKNLNDEIGLLNDQRGVLEYSKNDELTNLTMRHEDNEVSVSRAKNQLDRLLKQERSALKKVSQSQQYISEGLITKDVLSGHEEQLEQLITDRVQLESLLQDFVGQNQRMPYQKRKVESEYLAQSLEIKQKITQLETQIKNIDINSAQQMVASKSGKVTAMRAREGEVVSQGDLILVVVPQNSELYAEVFLPSSAIPFVQVGQDVRIAYTALPAEKFGKEKGRISSIASTAILSSELEVVTVNDELLYRVVVEIKNQKIKRSSTEIELLAGMEFKADILLDDRRLIDWVLPKFNQFELATR